MRSLFAALVACCCLAACSGNKSTPPSDAGGGATDQSVADLGPVCVQDSDCSGGAPRCDTTTGTCVACLPANDNCGSGSYCFSQGGVWACARGCRSDTDCTTPDGGESDGGAGTESCCNHLCVDITRDSSDCGSCGYRCGVTQTCVNAACQ